jgi:hypothetical protein
MTAFAGLRSCLERPVLAGQRPSYGILQHRPTTVLHPFLIIATGGFASLRIAINGAAVGDSREARHTSFRFTQTCGQAAD